MSTPTWSQRLGGTFRVTLHARGVWHACTAFNPVASQQTPHIITQRDIVVR